MLQGAPGISGCAAGSAMPFHEQPVDNAIATEGSPPQSPISAHFLASATQEYWRLMGIALLDGRALGPAEREIYALPGPHTLQGTLDGRSEPHDIAAIAGGSMRIEATPNCPWPNP